MLLWSCKKESGAPLTIKKISKTVKDTCNLETCSEVTLNYIEVSGNKEVSNKINNSINEFIIKSLLISDDSLQVHNTIAEAISCFFKTYNEDKIAFSETSPYFAEIAVNDLLVSPKLLSLEMNTYLFTGGAHGYGATTYTNFDAQTGENLNFADIIENKNKFLLLAEKTFKKQNKIPEEAPINATGFWFNNDTFYLPDSFGINSDKIIFTYNQYEIASYAAGPIKFAIPISEVVPYLKSPYKNILKQ